MNLKVVRRNDRQSQIRIVLLFIASLCSTIEKSGFFCRHHYRWLFFVALQNHADHFLAQSELRDFCRKEEVMKILLLAILMVTTFPLPLWGQPPTVKPGQGVSLVFSSNVQGEIEPCG